MKAIHAGLGGWGSSVARAGEDNIRSVALLDAARRSAATGERVTVDAGFS